MITIDITNVLSAITVITSILWFDYITDPLRSRT